MKLVSHGHSQLQMSNKVHSYHILPHTRKVRRTVLCWVHTIDAQFDLKRLAISLVDGSMGWQFERDSAGQFFCSHLDSYIPFREAGGSASGVSLEWWKVTGPCVSYLPSGWMRFVHMAVWHSSKRDGSSIEDTSRSGLGTGFRSLPPLSINQVPQANKIQEVGKHAPPLMGGAI